MESTLDWHGAKALLEWYIELGAVDAIGDEPVDRYALAEVAPKPRRAEAAPAPEPDPVPRMRVDPVAEASQRAAAAQSLADLAGTMAAFDGCELKKGARNFVFADGNPAARVMVVGEAPGREEDREGRPFVGRAGQLLDRMLAAIGLSRASPDAGAAVYITNLLPWRPPQNREPTPEEMAMMKPFLERHIELADPDVLILMGNTPCSALLGMRGVTRLRGTWADVSGKPAMPMTHPAYLLRNPEAKREAWADLLAIRAKLGGDT